MNALLFSGDSATRAGRVSGRRSARRTRWGAGPRGSWPQGGAEAAIEPLGVDVVDLHAPADEQLLRCGQGGEGDHEPPADADVGVPGAIEAGAVADAPGGGKGTR